MTEIFTLPVIAAIALNMLMMLLGYAINLDARLKKAFFSLPWIVQKLYVLFFMAPIILLPFTPHEKYGSFHVSSLAAGTILVVVSIVFWGLSLKEMRGIPSLRHASGLVTGGIYGLVRNPIYTANWCILPGLGLIAHSTASLMYAPVYLAALAVLSVLEERDLFAAYGPEYEAYSRAVPRRLIPLVF